MAEATFILVSTKSDNNIEEERFEGQESHIYFPWTWSHLSKIFFIILYPFIFRIFSLFPLCRYITPRLRKSKYVTQKSGTCSVMPNFLGLPGSSVHGISQPRILEWVAISFSRGCSQCNDQTQVSWNTSRFFINWVTREARYSRPLS